MIQQPYKKRPVRFAEVMECANWKIKIYGISVKNTYVNEQVIHGAKQLLPQWLKHSTHYALPTYDIATIIIHEGNEGIFAIVSWWIGENMMQVHVYFSTYEKPGEFVLYSDKGIVTCVWEMAVLWFERNAWIECVLNKSDGPDWQGYLQKQLNADV